MKLINEKEHMKKNIAKHGFEFLKLHNCVGPCELQSESLGHSWDFIIELLSNVKRVCISHLTDE